MRAAARRATDRASAGSSSNSSNSGSGPAARWATSAGPGLDLESLAARPCPALAFPAAPLTRLASATTCGVER